MNNSQAEAAFNSLNKSLTGSIAAGNVMADAISGAFGSVVNMAKSAAGSIASSLGQIADTQLSALGTAGDFSRLTGLTFAESRKDIIDFTEAMSKAAADLPGDTKAFVDLGVGISDNLVGAFKDLNGAFDKTTFDEYREALATAGAVRAEFAGITTADSSLAISKLLGGASVSELRQLKFFEANPAVLSFVEEGLTKAGKDIKDLTKRELADLTKTALEVSDEVLEASRNSTKGIIAGFKSNLFDPNVGLFGFARDLDKEVEGNQSVFGSLERVVKKVLGENGLFPRMAKLFGLIGLGGDPMAMLASGIGKLGIWIEGVTKWVQTINARLSAGGDLSKVLDFGELAVKIGTWLGEQVDGLFAGVKTKGAGSGAGKIAAGIVDGIAAFVAAIDWSGIADGATMRILEGLGAMLTNLSWDTVGTGLIALGAVALALLAKMAVGFALGAVAATAVTIGAPVIALGLAVVAVIGGLALLWRKQGDRIKIAIGNFFIRVQNWLTSILNKLPGKDREMQKLQAMPVTDEQLRRGADSLANKAAGLDQMGLLAAAAREARLMPSGSELVVANSSELIANRSQTAALVSAMRGGGASGLNISNQFIINGSDKSVSQIADEVARRIDQQFQQYSASKLSAAF